MDKKKLAYPVTDEDFSTLVTEVAAKLAGMCEDNAVVYDRLGVMEKRSEFFGAVIVMRGRHADPLFRQFLFLLQQMQKQGAVTNTKAVVN